MKTILVFATDIAHTVKVSSHRVMPISKPSIALKVSCPPVAETNKPYKCGFASLPGADNLTIAYDQPQTEHVLKPMDIDFMHFGNAPPVKEPQLDPGFTVEMPTAALDSLVLAQSRADSYTKILSVEWFGGDTANPLDIHVICLYYLLFCWVPYFYFNRLFSRVALHWLEEHTIHLMDFVKKIPIKN